MKQSLFMKMPLKISVECEPYFLRPLLVNNKSNMLYDNTIWMNVEMDNADIEIHTAHTADSWPKPK